MQSRKVISVVVALAVVGAAFFLGIGVGYTNRPAVEKVLGVANQETGKPANVDFNQFWDVWSRLESNYVDKEKIDRGKLIEGAIQGLVKGLGDPYTVYMPPEEAKQFQEDIKGSFSGIGAEIGLRKDVITVIAPLKGSPAEAAGIRAGDRILKIDDAVTADMTVEQAVRLIRGPKGTTVKLVVAHENAEKTVDLAIRRDTIVIPNIVTSQKPGIFVIHLSQFSESSPDDFRRAVGEFQRSGSTKLVLDLRNDPGGYLSAAVDIASWFIPAGDVIVSERWSDGREEVYRSRGYKALEKTPAVVLANQGSASASEILAGALRDNRGIKLVGQKTFGKGSVQELQQLAGGASLKITIAKWFTPSGKSISENGLEPDVVVEPGQELAKDLQLEKALELLK